MENEGKGSEERGPKAHSNNSNSCTPYDSGTLRWPSNCTLALSSRDLTNITPSQALIWSGELSHEKKEVRKFLGQKPGMFPTDSLCKAPFSVVLERNGWDVLQFRSGTSWDLGVHMVLLEKHLLV